MKPVRIFLLRVLIASWMIPGAWLLVWPLLALLAGKKEANESIVDLTKSMWNGV